MQAGVDEVGRGCLAGPVVAAAVVLFNQVEGLKDSKQLTPTKRSRLCDEILENAPDKLEGFFAVPKVVE